MSTMFRDNEASERGPSTRLSTVDITVLFMATHMMSRRIGPYDGSAWAQFQSDTAYLDSDGAMSIDNDGEGVLGYGIVDLSHALSIRLGRQMNQNMIYKVNYIRIELENKDDTVGFDNNAGASFGGKIEFYSPTHHRCTAMKMAVASERAYESTQIDGDSWPNLSDEKDYSGVRFGWNQDSDVAHQTAEAFAIAGTHWDMNDVFTAYGAMQGPPQETNALWSSRAGYPSSMGWTASYLNNQIDTDGINAEVSHQTHTPYEWQAKSDGDELSVLNGLLSVGFTQCSTDEWAVGADTSDDYFIRITVGVSGWEVY